MPPTILITPGTLVEVSKISRIVLVMTSGVVGVIASPLIRTLSYAHYRVPNVRTDIDSIMVLGTAQYNGRPSRQFAARLRHTAKLWRQFQIQRIYTVGGKLPGDRFSEAEVAREYLITEGVDPELVFVQPTGHDTWSSLAPLDVEHVGRVLVVTDPNHSHRAVRIARQLGFAALPSPTPFSPSKFPSKSYFLTLLHEWGGGLVLDVSALCGVQTADKLEEILRSFQAWIRPSRRARHEQLRRLKT